MSAAGTVAPAARVRCGDHLDLALTAAPPMRREASPRGFRRVCAAFFVLQAGGTLPVPLYVLWKERLGFGTGTLTLVFAVYALGTLTSLLLLAPLSDQIGRRPALLTAVGLAAVSTALFLVADAVAVLFLARFLSGMAVAMNTATGTAALRELAPAGRERRASVTASALNMGGLALGPLLAGLLAEYGSDPTRLVFGVYLALLVAAAAAIVSSSETVRAAARVVVRPRRLAVPPGARAEFAVAAATIFCSFTVLGLFSSLVPSFLATSLHENNHAVAGGVAAAIFAVATAVQVVLGRLSPGQALGIGLPVLIGGLALVEGGLRTEALGVVPGRDGRVGDRRRAVLHGEHRDRQPHRAAPASCGADGRVLRERLLRPDDPRRRDRGDERVDRHRRRDARLRHRHGRSRGRDAAGRIRHAQGRGAGGRLSGAGSLLLPYVVLASGVEMLGCPLHPIAPIRIRTSRAGCDDSSWRG